MKIRLSTSDFLSLKEALPFWCEKYAYACILHSNRISSACNHDSYEIIAGVADKRTQTYSGTETMDANAAWKLGYISYEFNHHLHGLQEPENTASGFKGCFFFEPQILLIIDKRKNEIEIIGALESVLQEILDSLPSNKKEQKISLNARTTKEEYISNVEKIKEQILEGDFYELNYCMEFFAEDAFINPARVFQSLIGISPTPFATFFKQDESYLLCASPERFLKRSGDKIIAQPIKGTMPRSALAAADKEFKTRLEQNEKERAENIMIVDLMRNDLSRCAETGTLKVEELLKVYSFATVHQFISTISASLKKNISFHEIIQLTFPMGSMTGAPKHEVMHAINQYEKIPRGIFSGSVGYVSDNKDFDLNVVIRSIVYNARSKYISCHVGSAITYDADAESEYNECLLKAQTMFKALHS